MARQSNPTGGGGGGRSSGEEEQRRQQEDEQVLGTPDTGGVARAPSASSAGGEQQQDQSVTPASGGAARAPEAPDSGGGGQGAPDTSTPAGGTPDNGGIPGAPGSGVGTVEPEIAGQAEQARQRIVEQNEGIETPSDVQLAGSTENQFQFRLSDAERGERRQDFLDRRGGQLEAVRDIQQRQPDFFDFEQAQQDFIDRRSGQIQAAQQAGEIEEQTARTAFGERLQQAEREAETESYTFGIPDVFGGGEFTLQGQARDVEPIVTQTDDGVSVEFEQQERFGDFDLSFGLGDPNRDEGEELLEAPAGFVSDAGTDFANLFAGSLTAISNPEIGMEAVEDFEQRTGRTPGFFDAPEIATQTSQLAREQGDTQTGAAFGFARSPFDLGATLVGAPELAIEGVELGAEVARDPQTVRELPGAVAGTGAALASFIEENPAEFTGTIAGSLPFSAGLFGAAKLIGPRASLATRAAIQPGEEALGIGGFATTRAVGNRIPGVEGEAAAQRLFPNQEPLFFSEEAAARGIQRIGTGARNRFDIGRNIFTGEQALPPTFRQQDIIDRFRPEGGTGEFTAEGQPAGSGFAGVGGELGTGGMGSLFDIETVSERGTPATRPNFETPTPEQTGTPSRGELPLFGEIQEAGGVRPFIRGEDLPPAIRPSQFETFLEEERAQAQLARQQQPELQEPRGEFTDFNIFEDTLAARQQNFGTFEGEGDPFGNSEFEERIRAAQAQEARVDTEQDTGRGVFSFETAVPGTDAFQGFGFGQLDQSLFGFDVGVDVAVDAETRPDVALESMQDTRVTQEQEQETMQSSALEVFGFSEQRQEFEFETETETESEFEFEFESEDEDEEFAAGLFGFQPQQASGETFQNPLAGGAEFLFGGSLDDIFGGQN